MIIRDIKNLFLFSIVFFFSFSVTLAQKNKAVRIKENFNESWKFQLSDSTSFKNENYIDSDWRTVNLPHDWSIEGQFSASNSGRNAWLPGGIGWYRKTFNISKEHKQKHFEIQFDGVYRHSQIWVNGQFVGVQYDGYTSFYFDITPFLNFDSSNVIAVRVDNSVQPNCRWYSGSGIYRNTWLTITDPLHVANWGTYITTPNISKNKAVVAIQTTLENYKGNVDFDLETIVFNSEGERVGHVISEVKADLMKDYVVNQELTIENPELWRIEAPSLYSTVSNVRVSKAIVDTYSSTFGIRSIKFDADNGFYLNDENIKLKGVCLHHEAGALGAAVPIEIWKDRLTTLKSIGCNAIRTAHNPTAPEFMDLCDEMGFLVMDEFVDKWNNHNAKQSKRKTQNNFFNPLGFADPYFELEWKKNYEATIKRDRNHPSVIIWSVGNENHSPGDVQQNIGLKKYTSFVRSLDPTRPVISGMERGKDKDVDEKVAEIIQSCSYMDLIALNYGEQWCRKIGDLKPGKPYVSTESYVYFNSLPDKRFANIEKSPWIDVLENKHNMGLFLWVGIDYLGESRKYPKLGSDCGLLDIAGFRNESSYLYEAFWSDKPVVRIAVYDGKADDFSTSGRWGSPPMKATWNLEKDKVYDLVTYTNCESVDLYVNGRKIGNKKLEDFNNWIMKWRNVAYEPGVIKAIGINKGKEVCDFEIKTVTAPHKIQLKPNKNSLSTSEVTQVEVSILDEKGNLVNNSEIDLNFQLTGDGEILASYSGNIKDIKSISNHQFSKTKEGKCILIIKSGKTKGVITLHATSKNIKSHSIILNVN